MALVSPAKIKMTAVVYKLERNTLISQLRDHFSGEPQLHRIERIMNRFGLILLALIFIAAVICIAFGASYFTTISGIQEGLGDAKLEEKLKQLGIVQSVELKENSGIALSQQYKDAMWMHNDSGCAPELFLVGNDGKTLAKCRVNQAVNKDWEDICCFSWKNKPKILVGDVGDNQLKRDQSRLLLIDEPKFELSSKRSITHTILKHKTIEFRFEDGPRNCEAIAFDAKTRSILMIEKIYIEVPKDKVPGVYQLQLKDDLTAVDGVAKRIGNYPTRNVTGMDIKGDRMVVRNYLFAHLIERGKDGWKKTFEQKRFQNMALPIQRQGEAICFDKSGQFVFVASEFIKQPLYRVTITDPKQAATTSPEEQRKRK